MKGMVVVVVGPDGTGKTTVADRLEAARAGRSLRIHHRPRVLPASGGGGDPTQPHATTPRGRIGSIAKATYVFVDYLVGWLLRVSPAKRSGKLVIIERGWWDMVIDPLRYRLQGVEPLMLQLGRWLPRPDLHVILHAAPELLMQRKSEISERELTRQMDGWRELEFGKGALFVDCSATPEQVVETILESMNAQRAV